MMAALGNKLVTDIVVSPLEGEPVSEEGEIIDNVVEKKRKSPDFDESVS